MDVIHAEADFCITLGGDGTVLHLTSLFVADEPLPPVVAFAMGTLGGRLCLAQSWSLHVAICASNEQAPAGVRFSLTHRRYGCDLHACAPHSKLHMPGNMVRWLHIVWSSS